MNYLHLTKLNINPLKDNLVFSDYIQGVKRETWGCMAYIPMSDLNTDLLNIIDDAGLLVIHSEIFYTFANTPSVIHTDVPGDLVKMNFAFGGKNSKMHWYEAGDHAGSSLNTPISTSYTRFKPDEVILVEQGEIGFPTIVQVGIPHNVVTTDEDRFCISLVLLHKTQNTPCENDVVSMKQATQIFKNYI